MITINNHTIIVYWIHGNATEELMSCLQIIVFAQFENHSPLSTLLAFRFVNLPRQGERVHGVFVKRMSNMCRFICFLIPRPLNTFIYCTVYSTIDYMGSLRFVNKRFVACLQEVSSFAECGFQVLIIIEFPSSSPISTHLVSKKFLRHMNITSFLFDKRDCKKFTYSLHLYFFCHRGSASTKNKSPKSLFCTTFDCICFFV